MSRRRRKSAPGSTRSETASTGWMEGAFRSLWPAVRRALPWVMVAAVVGVGGALGAGYARREVSRRDKFQVRTAALAQAHPIPALRRTISIEPVDLPPLVSAVEPGLAPRIAQAFLRNPWVQGVQAVRVSYPNQVAVTLVVRQPVAGVEVRDQYYLVDVGGVQLPAILSRARFAETRLLAIRGVLGAVPTVGRPWDDPGVRPGAETALVLAADAGPLGLTAVDVSNINGRRDPRLSEIVVRNSRQAEILWGRPPSTDRPGELSADQKLRQLREAARRNLLDSPREVDIRFPNLLPVREPPSAT